MQWKDPYFWLAVGVALAVRMRSADAPIGVFPRAASIFVAVGSAAIAGHWAAEQTGIDGYVAAGLVALTAESVMSRILFWANNPEKLLAFIRGWRK